MEFVQASQDNKKKKQIKAVTDANSFSRIFIIFEVFRERMKDFREEKKSLELMTAKPGEEDLKNRNNEFRMFYIVQGYMLMMALMDLITNFLIIILSFRLIREVFYSLLGMKDFVSNIESKISLSSWFIKFTDLTSFLYNDITLILKSALKDFQIGDFIFSKIEVLNIFPFVLMIFTIYIINMIIIKTIKTNVIEIIS